MPCPIHGSRSMMSCPQCNAFAGGFYAGIILWPINIANGMIGASRPTAMEASRQIEAVQNIARAPTGPEAQQAMTMYRNLPPPVRDGISLGAHQAGGTLSGSMIISGLVSAFLGRATANYVAARLGPQHLIARTPATIAFAGLFTYFGFVNATKNYIQQQEELFRKYPDAKPPFDDVVNKFGKGPPPPPPGGGGASISV